MEDVQLQSVVQDESKSSLIDLGRVGGWVGGGGEGGQVNTIVMNEHTIRYCTAVANAYCCVTTAVY